MTDSGNAELSRFGRRRFVLALGAVSALALSVTAIGVAGSAKGFPGRGFHGGSLDPEERAERAAFIAFRLGRAVDATPEQQIEIEGLLQAGFAELGDLEADRRETHAEVVALLTAPEIDRTALEALRAEKLAAMEAMSRRLVTLLGDVAEVLTPEQRLGLADFAHEFHRFGRRRH